LICVSGRVRGRRLTGKRHVTLPASTASTVGSRSVAMERLRTNPLAPASIAANLAFFSSWTLRAISFSCGKWLRIRRINPSPSPRGSERSTTARATVKSLSAHALRSLIIARKKLVGQRVTLENQIRGLAVCRHARFDCCADGRSDGGRSDRCGHETYDQGFGGLPPADDHPRCRPIDRARVCGRNRRSVAHPPIARCRRLSRLGPQAVSVRGGRLRRQHLEMRRPAVRTLLYEAANGHCHINRFYWPLLASEQESDSTNPMG
jgi:hypothetical protein